MSYSDFSPGRKSSPGRNSNTQKTTNSTSHKLRLSIDIHSLRANNFKGNIYCSYPAYSSLNIENFKTIPNLTVVYRHNEEQLFDNGFCAYEFVSEKTDLLENLKSTEIKINVMASDRLQKDQEVGIVTVKPVEILKFPIKKTKQSYVRIFDQLHPIGKILQFITSYRHIPCFLARESLYYSS